MKKILFCITVLTSFVVAAQTKLVQLSSDKAVYTQGETASLKAYLLSKPTSPNFQFDVQAKVNNQSVATERITDFQYFYGAKNLTAGSYTWQVTVVIQDARYARDLKTSITYYVQLVENLDGQIATETDPVRLEALQRRKSEALALKQAAEKELESIQTPIAEPVELNFTVN